MKRSSSSSVFSFFSNYCSSKLLLRICIVCTLLSGTTKALIKMPPNETIPAVFAFGDSIVDTGNNNNLKTLIKCNFPPYGQDFEGGIPTGRFCNGKVPADFLAHELGIKEAVPAYLDPNLSASDLTTGVCFASGGCGFDPLTPKLVSAISLSQQLQYFQEYVTKLKGLVGEDKTKFILANSIFLIVAGSDDIANTYFTLRARQAQYDVPAYTDLMANSAAQFVQKLYALGARRIAVFGAPPIGCVPAQRTLAGGKDRDCADNYNQAALLFNKKLAAELDSIQTRMPNNRVVYVDVYSPLLDLIQNPQQHGFEIADKGCCGTGIVEVAVLCNQLTSSVCADPSSYVFWDGYHPTERAYKILTTSIIQKYIKAFY